LLCRRAVTRGGAPSGGSITHTVLCPGRHKFFALFEENCAQIGSTNFLRNLVRQGGLADLIGHLSNLGTPIFESASHSMRRRLLRISDVPQHLGEGHVRERRTNLGSGEDEV